MEFKFNVNDIFKQPIVEINQNLIPPGFSGDRRALWDTVGKVSEIVNAMGEASAAAQGLTKPITTAERLRNSEHKLYFLIDQASNSGKGAIVGMLKTGKKGLYVFDREGQHYQVSPPCVLDFYVHESRQRAGLGKQLFEHMLQKEEIEPVKMAIDRPSEKFLGFLNKHYTLNSPVKQMNNFVVFDDFFPKVSDTKTAIEPDTSGASRKKESANGLQSLPSPYGRYGAPRPPCSMGQIIHNQTSAINKRQDATGPILNNVTQSAPNVCYGQRILNDMNQNTNTVMSTNPYLNQPQPYNYNPPVMNNEPYLNQTSAMDNSLVYQNTLQPTASATRSHFDNQFSMASGGNVQRQPQNVPQNYPNAQYLNNQNIGYTVNQNQIAPLNQHGDQGNFNQQQSYNSQSVQDFQNNKGGYPMEVQPPMINRWIAPNVVYSQPAFYSQNEQNQSDKNAASQNINPANQQATSNIHPVEQRKQLQLQNQQVPNATPVLQNNIPSNYVIPQAFNAGDNLQNQNVWNQKNSAQNYQNYPSNLDINATNAKQVPHYGGNIMQVNNTGTPMGYSQPQIEEKQLPSNQNQVNSVAPQVYQYPVSVVPQDAHIRKNASSPAIPLPYHNLHQAYAQSVPNIPQQQILPAMQTHPQSQQAQNPQLQNPMTEVASYTHQPGLETMIPQPTTYNSQPMIPQPTTYNSQTTVPQPTTYNSQTMVPQSTTYNSHPMVPQPTTYNSSFPSYPPNIQMSKNNLPDAYVAPSMSQGDVQRNMSNVGNTYTTEEFKNKQVGDALQKEVRQSQEAGHNNGDEHNVENIQGEKVRSSPKLERPRSLSIQQSEEQPKETNSNDVNSKTPETATHEPKDSPVKLEEGQIEKGEAQTEQAPLSEADNLPAGKKTPSHLTEQGYLDLKFYHNKLW